MLIRGNFDATTRGNSWHQDSINLDLLYGTVRYAGNMIPNFNPTGTDTHSNANLVQLFNSTVVCFNILHCFSQPYQILSVSLSHSPCVILSYCRSSHIVILPLPSHVPIIAVKVSPLSGTVLVVLYLNDGVVQTFLTAHSEMVFTLKQNPSYPMTNFHREYYT